MSSNAIIIASKVYIKNSKEGNFLFIQFHHDSINLQFSVRPDLSHVFQQYF